jgi:MtrB/PioB family decaheme-associated outer membrane protein
MKAQSNSLTSRRTALLGSAVLLMLLPSAPVFAADVAADQGSGSAVDSGWYVNGTLEAGGNFFVQRPPRGFGKTATDPFWLTPLTTDSRAKFEEYGRVPPGPFMNDLSFRAGSKDNRYAIDFWATDIAQNNQSYYLALSEIGRHYLTFSWDQIPHLLSTSAKSIFGGVGSARLTVDPASRIFLQSQMGNTGAGGSQSVAQRTNIDYYINGTAPMSNITLKTLREKFSTTYRGTPSDDWDFSAGYSHEHRTGVRPLGIGYGYANTLGGVNTTAAPRPSTGAVEIPQPIDDTTQIVNAAGQYVGTTPWGTRWTVAAKYSGSLYDDKLTSIDVDNPFCITCIPWTGGTIAGGAGTQIGPNLLRYSLPPSNSAHGFTLNSGTDFALFKSHYVSTLQYVMYRQDDPFINTATNGVAFGLGAGQLIPYPATSLNGEINTFLSNNVLTSQLTNNVSNTMRVRFYDINDRTPQLVFNNYNWADGGVATGAEQVPVTRARQSYSKLNINDEVKWRATKQLTVGGGYFFERYAYTNGEIDHSNESAGKIFVDHTPWKWLTTRTSYLYSQRRYGEYEDTGVLQTRPMRLFFIANRDRHKAQSMMEIAAFKNVTISPNGGVRWDDYPDGVPNLLGTTKDHSWNVGSDLGVRMTPDLRFTFSYNYEEHQLHMAACCGNNTVVDLTANTWQSDITQRYNTFMVAANWNAIPGKLDFRADYTAVLALEANSTTPCTNFVANNGCAGLGTGVTLLSQTKFPDEKNNFQRFNVIARYFIDPEIVRRMGWNGEVVTKLRYTWERNHNTNWATDNFSPYSPSSADAGGDTTNGGRSLFLAYNNPNYTAQIIAASLALKW